MYFVSNEFLGISLLFYIGVIQSHKHHPVPTYFYRKYPNGTLIDRKNTVEFNRVFNQKYMISNYGRSELSVYPNEGLRHGQNVTVTWKTDMESSEYDWIGLFCPKEGHISHVLDYFHVTVAENWKSGVGHYEVFLLNLRTDCEFRYYQFEKALLLATSDIITFENGPDEPLQGHISSTGSANEMRVMWVSGTDESPVVYYGLTNPGLILKSRGTTKTYNASQMCAFPAFSIGFKSPGFIHDALLKPLLSNTRYYYQFGSGKIFSPVYNFTTPLPGGDSTPHSVITYGDHGVVDCPGAESTSDNVLHEYRTNNIRMVLHNGDISYAMGYAYIWEKWFSLVQPYSTLVPYMVTIGNHEQDHLTGGSQDPSGAGDGFHPIWGNYGDDSGGECGVPMYYRFHMPDNGHSLWWYSYDFGLVHYVIISTEHDYSPGTKQYAWLENDLKSVDRKLTPWLVVAGHRPMYTSQEQLDEIEVSINMQRLFEDLLYTYEVDLALWGHVHSYQRTCKVYKNKCNPSGVVHIVTGTAGRPIDYEFFLHKEWLKFTSEEYGYGRLKIFNSTVMQYEFVSNQNRKVVDSYWFRK